jgi:NADPH:quinone reductase-like Zn-dependent oxidoreductase
MKAIRVHQHGGPDVLKLEDQVSIPQAGPNQVQNKIDNLYRIYATYYTIFRHLSRITIFLRFTQT